MTSRIAILPARGGSKRIPNKNIRNFCGKPMLGYILNAALSSALFDKIHVSTDSHEIAETVTRLGFEVDFLRPEHLADDHAPIMPVLKYVLDEYLKRGIKFECVALLMPCAPMITSSDLCEAVELFDTQNANKAVIGVSEYPCPVEWAFHREPNGVLVPIQPGMFSVRSQDLETAYYDAGQFCVMSAERVLTTLGAGSDQGFIGYPIKRHQAIDIDTLDDWRFAELIFNSIQQNMERA